MSHEESGEPDGGGPSGPGLHLLILCANLYGTQCGERLLVPAAAFVAGPSALNASVAASTWVLAQLAQPTPEGPVPFLAFMCPKCVKQAAKIEAERAAAAAARAKAAPKSPDNLPPLPNIIGNRRRAR